MKKEPNETKKLTITKTSTPKEVLAKKKENAKENGVKEESSNKQLGEKENNKISRKVKYKKKRPKVVNESDSEDDVEDWVSSGSSELILSDTTDEEFDSCFSNNITVPMVDREKTQAEQKCIKPSDYVLVKF